MARKKINIQKLLLKGRLERITKSDVKGNVWLVGYRRKSSRSRKGDGEIWLPRAKLIAEAGARDGDAAVAGDPVGETGTQGNF